VVVLCAAFALLPAAGALAMITSTQGRTLAPTAGTEFTDVVGSFTADAPLSGVTAQIDWGDQGASAGQIVEKAFEQGQYRFEVHGTHRYAAAGQFAITVTLEGPNQPATQIQSTANVSASQPPPPGDEPPPPEPEPPAQNKPPVASFAPSVAALRAGAPLGLDASASGDADGSIREFAWDLDGNGSFETDCGSSPAAGASFGSPGSVTIGLRVTDTAGATAISMRTVAVGSRAKGAPGAPSRVTLGACRKPESLGKPALDFTGACLRTVATRIAEVTTAGCFAEDGQEPGASSAQVRPLFERPIVQHYWSTPNRVRVNGIDVTPGGGALVVIHKEGGRLYTKGGGARVTLDAASVGLGKVLLKTGPLDWKLPFTGSSLRIAEFDVAKAADLFGFDLEGRASVELTKGGSGGPRAEIPVHVALPGVFKDPTTGKGITADVRLRADNARKLYLDALRLEVPKVFMGGLEISDLSVEYQSEAATWQGGAKLVLPSGYAIDARPPPPRGFGFRDGAFDYAGAELLIPDPGVLVFSGVYLNKVGVFVETRPTRFTGTALFTAGSAGGKALAKIDAELFVAFATPSEPYLRDGKRYETLTIGAAGEMTLAGTIPLATARIVYRYPAFIELGGKLEYTLISGRLFARANIGGFADLSTGRFNAEAAAELCVNIGLEVCQGGAFVVSSRGAGACVYTFFANVGGGIYWSGGVKLFWKSCDIGAFRATASRAQADGSFEVQVRDDVPFRAVEVIGRDGPPDVELTAPDGRKIATPASGFLDSREAVIWRGSAPGDKSTFVMLPRTAAGRWRVAPAAGSSPIASIRTGDGLAEPRVSARVRGRGRRRTLAWSAVPQPGHTVTFVERGPQTYRVLGRARGRSGTIAFTPGDGPAGRRVIEAIVENDGIPRKTLTVARYVAPRPAGPGRPRGLRVRRTRTGLRVSWRRVPGAAKYAVSVQTGDGRRRVFSTRRTRLRVPAVTRRMRGRLRVAGLTVTNTAGPSASRRLR